jgi:hypothetical protein
MAIKLPPHPRQDDTDALDTWYTRVRLAIQDLGTSITWANLDKTGSNLSDIQTRHHNSLQNIQGGDSTNRYHLNSAQYTNIEKPYGLFLSTVTHTLSAIDTGFVIPINSTPLLDGVSLVGGTKITMATAGTYNFSFSAQLTSSSASAKDAWFWPRVNGVDVSGSTIKYTTTSNSATVVVSRSALFAFDANDYLEICWAGSSLAMSLEAVPATAFAPATPSVTLSVVKVQ